MIPLDTKAREQKYLKKGGIYCKDCVRKMLSEKMKKNNPMSDPKALEKLRATFKEKKLHPKVLGGNGRGYSRGQKELWRALGRGWWAEFIVPTGHHSGLPSNFKIDLANIYYGIAVEVDGGSHTGKIAREEDARKTAFLESKGWKVLRFRNKEVLDNIQGVVDTIMSTISKSKETTITLPMDY